MGTTTGEKTFNPVGEDHKQYHQPEPKFWGVGIQQHQHQYHLCHQPGQLLAQQFLTSLLGGRVYQLDAPPWSRFGPKLRSTLPLR